MTRRALGGRVRLVTGAAARDIERWLRELTHTTEQRRTLNVGILHELCKHSEAIIKAVTTHYASRAGVAGTETIRLATEGKKDSPARLTLAECINVLGLLDDQKVMVKRTNVLSRRDRALLDRMRTARNRYVHEGSGEVVVDATSFAGEIKTLLSTRCVRSALDQEAEEN